MGVSPESCRWQMCARPRTCLPRSVRGEQQDLATCSPSTRRKPIAVTDEHRQLMKRAADPCRAQPATYVAVVRRADQLRADGTDHFQAPAVALDSVALLDD